MKHLQKFWLMFALLCMSVVVLAQSSSSTTDRKGKPVEITPEMQAYIDHLSGKDKPASARKAARRNAAAQTWSYPETTPETPFGGGTGTEEDPYLITSAQELANLSYMVNSGYSYSDEYFKMTRDIVLNDNVLAEDGSLNIGEYQNWVPIGNEDNHFYGNFDGDGNEVSGICIISTDYGVGLFGFTSSAVIANLGVVDSYIYTTGSWGGGISGYCDGGAFTKCYNSATIITRWEAGGIVGYALDAGINIESCFNTGCITVIENNCSGGICGYIECGNIKNSYNIGKIVCQGTAASGITTSDNSNYTITNCFNLGSISYGSSTISGPITGQNVATNCYYLSGTCNVGIGYGTSKSAEEFADGTVLALLDSAGTYFYQGPDYPMLIGVGTITSNLPRALTSLTTYIETLDGYDALAAELSVYAAQAEKAIADSIEVDEQRSLAAQIDSVMRLSRRIEAEYNAISSIIDEYAEIVQLVSNVEFKTKYAAAQQVLANKASIVLSSLDDLVNTKNEMQSATDALNLGESKLNDWTSTNHDDGSTSSYTWNINAVAGHNLTFDWAVSSESGCDWLRVYLNDVRILEQSGEQSGHYSSTFESSGNMILSASYSKDGSVNNGNDNATVYNVMGGRIGLWTLSDLRMNVKAYIATLDSFPGLKNELQTAYDASIPANDSTGVVIAIDELTYIYNKVQTAVADYPIILSDLAIADSVLTIGAYVDVAEAVTLGRAIDVTTSKSAEYIAAFEALETSLAIQHADQIDMADWAFNTGTVYTVGGLRYYFDETNRLAEFIGFNNSNSSLKELNIPNFVRPDSVTYCVVAVINANTNTQSNIISVTLPKSLRYLGDCAFAYYTNLTSLEIPENVTAIGSHVLYETNNLRALKVNATVPPTLGSLNGTSYRKITIPAESFHAYRTASVWNNYVLIGGDGVTVSTGKISAGELGRIVLDEASYIQEVNKLIVDEGSMNNDDWTTIKNMTNLIEVDLSGVTMSALPSQALYNRWAIEKVVLPSNLQTIGSNALGNIGVKSIDIPESVNTINEYAFYNCDSLREVTIPNAVETIPYCCFNDCDNLEKVILPDSLRTISSNAFSGCYKLCDITLPETLTSIGSYAFQSCPIKSIKLPEGITSINERTFASNTVLDSIALPSSITSINQYAFSGCTELKKVEFNEGLKNIYYNAFYNCKSLTEVVLPSSLVICQDNPFNECDGIKKFEVRAVIPPSTNGDCPLTNVDLTDVVLYVPSWSVAEYQLASGWSSFYTVEATDFMPQNIIVNKDFYFTLKDTLAADYRPNITLNYSDVESTDSYDHWNYERGNLTISGRSKLAVNNFSIECSPYAKYYADENVRYGYDYDYYRTNMNSTCLLVNGEMRAENVNMWLTTYNNRWQFVTFPFDVKVSDIVPGANNISWVIRKHNGKARAEGKTDSVWEDMNKELVETEEDSVPKFSPVATDGNTIQYLYNVETGTYLVGANNWGTRASVSSEEGYQLMVQLNEDGTYTLNDYTGSRWSALDCDGSLSSWVDGNGRLGYDKWHLTLVGDNIYEITNENAGDLKWGVDPTLADSRVYFKESDQASTWAFVNQEDYTHKAPQYVYTDTLKAGVGYIMHTYNPSYSNSWFSVSPLKNSVNRQNIFTSNDVTVPLEENLAEFDHNRSWNLIGNPYPCFYDTRFMDFDAPFMVWNSYSQSYVAYNPADDAYILSPGEAFFVQRPFDQESITFLKDGRQTHRYAREMSVDARNQSQVEKSARQLCNIILSQDSLMDRTRVVFNESADINYEMSRDAAKFASTDKNVPQIFTVNGKTRYAINERPALNGDVALGVYCGSDGEYAISLSSKFDGKVVLEDKTMNIFCEISEGKGYTFNAKAGEYLNRFVLHFQNEATGINTVDSDNGNNAESLYSIQGIKVDAPVTNGVYIKNGQKTVIK